MKKFKSIRNGQVAELISENEKQVIIKLETGEEKAISPATLKRWWKEMEEEPQSEEVVTEATQEETTEEPVEEPAEEVNVIDVTDEEPAQIDFTEFEDAPEPEEQPEPKKEKKPKKKRERISGDRPLKEFIEGLATERNTEVFQATVPSFRSLKVDGKMYMAFTFNKKGVTLWMRSAAVQDITEYKKMNHMFDARVQFGEDNAENRKEITKLLDASLKFQIDKQAARASKK